MIKFGDIFCIKEIEYVYLLQKSDVLYAARILGIEDTQKLEGIRNRQCKTRGGQAQSVSLSNTNFCFVVLTTENFEGRGAHLGRPYTSTEHERPDWAPETLRSLNEEDLERLKEEIRLGPVPMALKNFINEL
jgi:hypothetical protein